MSFRLFIYYCTLVGAWAAFVGWALARLIAPQDVVAEATTYGLFLGLTIAFGLSLLDALWNFSVGQFVSIFARVAAAMLVGLIGSAACSGIAGLLFRYLAPRLGFFGDVFFILGWIGLGFMVGISVSVFDLFAGLARKDVRGPLTKVIKCTAGGVAGGAIGGLIAWLLRFQVGRVLGDASGNSFWTPSAYGFVSLGALIGLLVGLSQVFLMEAWIKIEAGFRPGRDLILSRDRTTIGRAEGCDIALFGDNGVEKEHALIVLDRGGYYLEPLPHTPGTYINELPIATRTRLATGDLIRVGKSLLRFNERRKR
jgi:hypothetical protein